MVKALESLAEKGKVREKTYGKQKVYVADQVRLKPCSVDSLREQPHGIVSNVTFYLRRSQSQSLSHCVNWP